MTHETEPDTGAIDKWVAEIKLDPKFLTQLRHLAEWDLEPLLAAYAAIAKALVSKEPLDPSMIVLATEKVNASRDELVECVATITTYFAILPKGVSAEQGITFLQQRGAIPETQVPCLQERLRILRENRDAEAAIRQMKGQMESGKLVRPTLPTLKGFWTRCVAISKFDQDYKRRDNPDEYNPTVQGFLPMIVLQVDINAYGRTHEIALGLTEEELGEMINRLKLAERQLKALKKSLNTDGNPEPRTS